MKYRYRTYSTDYKQNWTVYKITWKHNNRYRQTTIYQCYGSGSGIRCLFHAWIPGLGDFWVKCSIIL
jgi:hypothetical protein